jgi:hypothetical protein
MAPTTTKNLILIKLADEINQYRRTSRARSIWSGASKLTSWLLCSLVRVIRSQPLGALASLQNVAVAKWRVE